MTRKFFHYLWGMIVRPRSTIDELAQETSIRYAVALVFFGVALTLFNLLLFVAFGFDWLGTRRELPSPTYVGFFGRLSVGTDDYVTIFNFLIVRVQDIVNSFACEFYLVEGSGHREHRQVLVRRANSGVRRATISEIL